MCSFEIDKINFGELIDLFFWDCDFLMTSEDSFESGLEGRKAKGISSETFAISMGLRPHPDELVIKVYDVDPPRASKSVYFNPESRIYPALKGLV